MKRLYFMNHEAYDVIVVGAGPAGVSAALACSRQGLSVLVLEKSLESFAKLCGEGFMPKALALFHDLELSYEDYAKVHGMTFFAGDYSASTQFSRGCGLGINRLNFALALEERLLREKNTKLLRGARFLSFDAQRNLVTFTLNSAMRQAQCRLLIGADGLRSKVQKSLKLKSLQSKNKRFALGVHLDAKPWSSNIEVYFAKEIEAYLTPTGPNELNLVFLWSNGFPLAGYGAFELFSYFLKQFPKLEKRVLFSQHKHEMRACGPFDKIVPKKYLSHKAILIGDAAGYSDPLSGEGMSMALVSGQILGETLGKKLKNGRLSAFDLAIFHQRLRLRFMRHEAFTKVLLTLSKNPQRAVTALKLLAKKPNLLRHLVNAAMVS
jgi:flavin-dependent dehydrogenase